MNRKSFTLIELLIVIIILAVLATLLTGSFFTSLKKGRDAKRKADLESIQKSVEMFYEDKRSYPTFALSTKLCETSDVNCPGKVYMEKVPSDPLSGSSYGYEYDLQGTYYKLYACLENDLQILPYISSPNGFTCSHKCKDQSNNAVDCIWGISSGNTTP